jgi:hypothetical protein
MAVGSIQAGCHCLRSYTWLTVQSCRMQVPTSGGPGLHSTHPTLPTCSQPARNFYGHLHATQSQHCCRLRMRGAPWEAKESRCMS